MCRRCRKGHQHVCEHRQEVGVRGGHPGALAEQLGERPEGAGPGPKIHVDPRIG